MLFFVIFFSFVFSNNWIFIMLCLQQLKYLTVVRFFRVDISALQKVESTICHITNIHFALHFTMEQYKVMRSCKVVAFVLIPLYSASSK